MFFQAWMLKYLLVRTQNLKIVVSLLTVALTTLLGAVSAQAKASPYASFAGLSTADFHLLKPAECRVDFKRFEWSKLQATDSLRRQAEADPQEFGAQSSARSAFLDWTPDGSEDRPADPNCQPGVLDRALLAAGPRAPQEAAAISKFFARCGRHLERRAPGGILALARLYNNVYPTCENPNIRKVVIHLDSLGTKVTLRALLALKPGVERRPLIIFRCGVFCNAGDISHRIMLMHLFDQGPFNILAISGVTGAEYVVDNGFVSVGGFDEGHQMIRLAKMVQGLPLAKRVSSMHALGVSLGGQSALFASELNDFNRDAHNQPYFSSVLAISPVVDLLPSMKSLFEEPVKGRLAKYFFFEEFYKAITFMPILGQLFPNKDHFPRTQIPDVVAHSAADYYSKTGSSWFMEPFRRFSIHDVKSLWDANRFSQLALHPLKTPTLVFSADDDLVVSTRLNAAYLHRLLEPVPNSNLQVVTVPHGSHVAFDLIYGWSTISSLFQGFFLAHSPELLKSRHFSYATFPLNRIRFFTRLWRDSETYETHTFKFAAGVQSLFINFGIFSRFQNQSACLNQTATDAENICYRNSEMQIPFSELRGVAPWAHVPLNGTEAAAMSRWANYNMAVIDVEGKPVLGTNHTPVTLRWTSYQPR